MSNPFYVELESRLAKLSPLLVYGPPKVDNMLLADLAAFTAAARTCFEKLATANDELYALLQ